jgi:hypothetical protein
MQRNYTVAPEWGHVTNIAPRIRDVKGLVMRTHSWRINGCRLLQKGELGA